MNCEKLQKQIHDQDGLELGPEAQEHLTTCTACDAIHKQVIALRQLLSLKQYEQPDSAFADRIAYKVRTRLENAPADEQAQGWLGNVLGTHGTVTWRFGLVAVLFVLLAIQLFMSPAHVGNSDAPLAATDEPRGADVLMLASTNLAGNDSVPIMQIVSNTHPGAQSRPENVRFVGQ